MKNGEDRVRNEVSGSDVGKVFQAGTMHVALGAVGGGPAPTALASLPAPPVDLVGRGEVSEALLALLAPSAGDGEEERTALWKRLLGHDVMPTASRKLRGSRGS
ncbi:hypothetical protein ABZW10_32820 [Kitasatospora sp. NPDC004723]|uniref:hypothetical protein n=1 Tax=Kitasatospora sp. NPDC004723 TaxID=3154288 RepID=UPI0033A0A0EE